MIDKPRIIVFDAPEIATELTTRNFSVRSGTFGTPFKVEKSDSYGHVPIQFKAPGLPEADLIVADLASPPASVEVPNEDLPAPGVKDTWSSQKRGTIDPRPWGMRNVSDLIDRLYRHGGVIIAIAAARINQPYVSAEIDSSPRGRGRLSYISQTPMNNWGLCAATASNFHVEFDSGQEIVPTDAAEHLGLGGRDRWRGQFRCTIEPTEYARQQWIPLAANKYGADVAGVLCPRKDSQDGWLFILPPLDNIELLVADLIERELPRLAPRIFPAADRASWLTAAEYAHHDVLRYQDEIASVHQRAEAEVLLIEQKITAAQEAQAHLHSLLTGTGDPLVESVVTTLRDLGFHNVVDVDALKAAAGDESIKREDIQIAEEGHELVLGEVKGIEGLPKEANSLQVAKYLMPRARELGRTDIRGLSIVNHQRALPPLERNHKTVFQEDVLVNAEAQCITLLTGWEMFRLARNALRHGWRFETIRHIFYTNGRPEIVPTHYRCIGTVEKVWPEASAFAITLTASLPAGSPIALEGPVDFSEVIAASIRLDNSDVHAGMAGQKVGIAYSEDEAVVKEGMRVFSVHATVVDDAHGPTNTSE